MRSYFKTTIKCSGCVASVTPYLDKVVGAKNWQVDLNSDEKLLTVETQSDANEKQVIQAMESAGYKAERIN